MEMKRAEKLHLRDYKGLFVVICGELEAIVGPEGSYGMGTAREVFYRLNGTRTKLYAAPETIKVGDFFAFGTSNGRTVNFLINEIYIPTAE